MFPFEEYSDWSFQISDLVGEEQQNQVENPNDWTDLAAGVETFNTNVSLVGNNVIGTSPGRGRGRGRSRGRGRRTPSSLVDGNIACVSNCNENGDDETRKIIHREVERQRRQEMSDLFTSLRSILPADYIKGKRSTSDHLAEAVNYIKDLEKNVKDLAEKRDQLRETLELSTPTHQVCGSSNPRPCPGSVVINPCLSGFNIDIEVGYEDESFALSSALEVIIDEGIGVSSCTSNKFNEKMIHSIACEVDDITCINFSRLQKRLIDLVC